MDLAGAKWSSGTAGVEGLGLAPRAVPWAVSEPWKLLGVCPSLTGNIWFSGSFLELVLSADL